MRKLNIYVHVDGVRYGPDDTISDAVAAKITNPKVWAQREDPPPAADQTPPETVVTVDDPNRPRGNASREEWATYASGKDIQVTGQMNRDDIRGTVERWDAEQALKQGK